MSRTPKESFGTPYQIYSEIAKAGKNLASTKKRITWRFGWSEGDGDHEITLVHSLVSGKKVILKLLNFFHEVFLAFFCNYAFNWLNIRRFSRMVTK
jgi:hypothetical protein